MLVDQLAEFFDEVFQRIVRLAGKQIDQPLERICRDVAEARVIANLEKLGERDAESIAVFLEQLLQKFTRARILQDLTGFLLDRLGILLDG